MIINTVIKGDTWYDTFWDAFQNNGNRTSYRQAFYNNSSTGGWDDNTLRPKYDIVVAGRTMNMFYGCTAREMPFTIDLSNASQWDGAFQACNELETIQLIIAGIAFSSGSSTFTGCTSLKNITFEGTIKSSISFGDCDNLTKASITNIVNALYSSASGKTLTLSSTAIANAFTASEWETLKDTKSTWSYSEV